MEFIKYYEDSNEESDLMSNQSKSLEILNRKTSRQSTYKIRNFPHDQGSFPSHIFIKIKKTSAKLKKIHNEIKDLLINTSTLNTRFNSFLEEEDSEIHISLSQQLYLKYHQIDSFVNKIKTLFKRIKSQHILLSSNIKFFKNENSTRHFLSLIVVKSKFLSVFNNLFLEDSRKS